MHDNSRQHDTLPRLMLRNAARWPRQDAMRENKYGIWQSYSWSEYARQVRRLALGLASLGFKRGDKLAVIGDNRPRLYWAMLAAQSLGGVSVGVYQDAVQSEIGFVLAHAEVRFVVAEDVEQVDKLLEVRNDLPGVQKVLFDDPKGVVFRDDPWLADYAQVQALGDEYGQAHPGYFEAEVARGQADDVAIFSYTSGTTGMPKGAMLSHGNLIFSGATLAQEDGWVHTDQWLARLPMAWIGDFVFSVACALAAGFCINCPENRETVQRDYREIGPTIVFSPPRNWEFYLTLMQVRMEEADWLKHTLFRSFMRIALRVEKLLQAGRPVPLGLRVANRIGDWLVRSPLRDLLGLRRVRVALTGGAPLGPDVFNFFRALGVNLKVGYGLTESTALCVLQGDGEANCDTTGKPLGATEVKIADGGEVLIRGPQIFKGYYKNEEATRKTMDSGGWLRTGDAGFFDHRGHLKIIDRARDVGKLSTGTLFAPQYLENKLKFSPYIQEAVALGEGRDFVVSMINIDAQSLENWAERHGIPYAGYQDLSQKQETYRLIHDEIVKVNDSLAEDEALRGAQIRRFLILNKELDADDGEITRTSKLRRNVITDRYGRLMDALYNGADAVDTEVVVTYEDGRKATIRGRVSVWDVEGTTLRTGNAGSAAVRARLSA